MDNTIIVNPKEIILVKINKSQGFYAYVIDIIADTKPGWWQVKLCPLIPTSDFKLPELIWKLDDHQIRGSEFTMSNGVPHQLFKVEFPKSFENNNSNKLSDDNIPIPKKIKKEIPSYLRLIK